MGDLIRSSNSYYWGLCITMDADDGPKFLFRHPSSITIETAKMKANTCWRKNGIVSATACPQKTSEQVLWTVIEIGS